MSEDLPSISKKSPRDHIVNVVKATLAALPVAGAIASLIDDYIPKSTEVSLNNFIVDLKNRLEALGNRIEVEMINKDEFAELFISCYQGVVRTRQQDKIKIFARILANILLKEGDAEKVTYSELDHLVRAMDNISVGALRVLAAIFSYSSKISSGNRLNFSDISSIIKDLDPSLIMGLLNELNSVNLIHMPGAPMVRERDYANYPIELTELGRRFVEKFAS